MVRLSVVASFFVLQVAAIASAQVKLEQKINDGESYRFETTSLSKQAMSLGGMDLNSQSQQTTVMAVTAGKRAADGTIPVTHKVESLRATLNLPFGVDLKFDSANPMPPAGTQFDVFLDLFKALSQRTWTSVHDRSGRVVRVEGTEKLVESLNPQLRAMVGKQFDPAYQLQTANLERQKIAAQPVKTGDTWELVEEARMEGGQSMKFKNRYTYDGTVTKDGRQLDQITEQIQTVEMSIDPDNPNGMKLTKSDLKIANSSGALWFDRALGRVVASERKLQIQGTMTLDLGGMELPAKIDVTIENVGRLKP